MANENRSPLGRRYLDSPNCIVIKTEDDWANSGIDWDREGRAIVVPATYNIEWGNIHPLRPHILDTKYPHVCFECKRELRWVELYTANCEDIRFNMYAYRKLKKLWKSQVVEFYCCHCFQHRPIR